MSAYSLVCMIDLSDVMLIWSIHSPLISGLSCLTVNSVSNSIMSYSCRSINGILTVSPSTKSKLKSKVSIFSVVSSRILTSPYLTTVKCNVYVAYCVGLVSFTEILFDSVSSVMSIPLSTIEALDKSNS